MKKKQQEQKNKTSNQLVETHAIQNNFPSHAVLMNPEKKTQTNEQNIECTTCVYK